MKSIVCTKPHEFKLKEGKTPNIEPGEALVKIKKIGICGTDLHAFNGRQPYFSYPRVLGHELAGEIIEISDPSSGLKKGDHVAVVPYIECGKCIACINGKPNCCSNIKVLGVHTDGGMQELAALPVDHLIKNETLSDDELAMTECYAISAHAVRRAQVAAHETVLVIGAGPIGLGIVQFSKLSGANVIAMDIDPHRLDFAQTQCQCDHISLAGQENTKQLLEDVTDGNYPTVIFDATGNPKSMMQGFYYLAFGGRYILVSIVDSNITFYDPEFHKRETTLMSSRNATKDDFAWVMSCMENKQLVLNPMITHRCHFNELVETFQSWITPSSGVIKAVVEL